jgi:hypothetical protein
MTSSLLTEIGGRGGPPHLHGRFHSWQFAALPVGQLVLPGKQNIRKRCAQKSLPSPHSEDKCLCHAASVFWQAKQQDSEDFPCLKKGHPLQNLGVPEGRVRIHGDCKAWDLLQIRRRGTNTALCKWHTVTAHKLGVCTCYFIRLRLSDVNTNRVKSVDA